MCVDGYLIKLEISLMNVVAALVEIIDIMKIMHKILVSILLQNDRRKGSKLLTLLNCIYTILYI